jgi:ubiquinone/menaquinone biosynthesis C-methylase UbiE
MHEYLHGFAHDEQRRLVAQAEHFAQDLIPLGLDYKTGEQVLEVGCGAGAVLGVLGQRFPGVRFHGVDLVPAQVDAARQHLLALGQEAHVQVADARQLPQADQSLDHVFCMWVLEHTGETVAREILREAFRVLRPGGTIALTETDYSSFRTYPETPSLRALFSAQYKHYLTHGHAFAGRCLGPWLKSAGFTQATSSSPGFTYFADGTRRLEAHANYIADFLEPALDPLARTGFEVAQLKAGIAELRQLHALPEASLTTTVYRGIGVRP